MSVSPTTSTSIPSSPPPSFSEVRPRPGPLGPTKVPEYVLQGLSLSNIMDPVEAAYIAAAYATETRNILDAEAYLAERRYRQTLIAAQAARASMVKAVKKREDAITDVANMHDITMTATTGINCRPAPIDGGLVDSLYDDTAKLGYIGGFHNIIVSDGST